MKSTQCINFLLLACSTLISASSPLNAPRVRRTHLNTLDSMNETTTSNLATSITPSISSPTSTQASVTIYKAPPAPVFNSYQFPNSNDTTTGTISSTCSSTSSYISSTRTGRHSSTSKSHLPTNSTTTSSFTTTASSTHSSRSTSQSRFHSPANSTLTLGASKNSPTPTSTMVGSLASRASLSLGSWSEEVWRVVAAMFLGAALWV